MQSNKMYFLLKLFCVLCILLFMMIKIALALPIEMKHSNSTDKNLRLINSYASSDVLFPDSAEDNSPEKISKCSEHDTFCEDAQYYPVEKISVALNNASHFSYFFGEDTRKEEELSDRAADEQFVCPSYRKTIRPKIAKTKENKWKYILNQDSFIQGISVEICKKEGKKCEVVGTKAGYVTKCKQKYMYRRLLALSEDGEPVPDTFKLPSACCCSYKRNIDFLIRSLDPIGAG